MKLKRKCKYLFVKYLLKPFNSLKLSLFYSYGRFVLTFAVMGIRLPGLEKIKSKLSKPVLDLYERQLLIYEIKGERFSVRRGPIWFRKAFEEIIFIFDRNKIWFLIALKTLIAAVLIFIPIGSFILFRGMLPVPERVAYKNILAPISKKSNLRTDWPYTEGPFIQDNYSLNNNFNIIDPTNARGATVTPVLEPGSPAGLSHFGIGYYPSKLNLMRGFIASESKSLIINRQKNIPIEIQGHNVLRIQYYLLPSPDSDSHQCKIELRDENENIIVNTTQITLNKNSLGEEKGIAKSWHAQFTPDVIPENSKLNEFIINAKIPPKKITVSVKELNAGSPAVKTDPAFLNNRADVVQLRKFYPKANFHDVTNDSCVFALGDFSYERKVVHPLKRRGIIFILVDTLREITAYDKDLMPNLNQFANSNGIKFLEHRAQGNMTVPSVTALMTSRYAREIGPTAFAYAVDPTLRKNFYDTKTSLLPTTMQNLGYRVGGIGWLSLFTEAMQGGLDLGFHNAIVSENYAYEARIITEQMGEWLETYGESPFFLYVHYNTMHGPYKPPFSNINLSKFLSKPFGLNQKKQLYDALGKYWDDEFLNIIQKLKDLGIYDDVDIIITADHGAQFKDQPWEYLSGVERGITGGYAEKGHSLLDEEVRVPLIFHLANTPNSYGSVVEMPTGHIDLFPTIYNLAGGNNPESTWHGLNLNPGLTDKFRLENILNERDFMYFDAHRYAGLLYWGNSFKTNPIKYIRQFNSDDVKLYLTHNPWHLNIRWFQPEIFTSINFQEHSEKWVPIISNKDLRDIRKIYYNISPSDKILRITSRFSGNFSGNFTFSNSGTKRPKIELVPDNFKIVEKGNNIDSAPQKNANRNSESALSVSKGPSLEISLAGNVKVGDGIWINLGDSNLEKVFLDKSIKPITCQNGNIINLEKIQTIFEDNVCPFYNPPDGILEGNYTALDKLVLIQKSLSNEQVEQIEGKGAGEALQKALREWGYAK